MSEEELKALGYREDANGNWTKPDNKKQKTQKSPGIGNPGQLSKRQSGIRRPAKRSTKAKKENEASSQRRNSQYIAVVVAYKTKKNKGADTDNICPKWFIDEIVKSGICPADLTDDNFEQICLTLKTIKRVKTRKEEKTVIKIYRVES